MMIKNIKDTFEAFAPSEAQQTRIYEAAIAGGPGIDGSVKHVRKLKPILAACGGVLLIAAGLLIVLGGQHVPLPEPGNAQYAQHPTLAENRSDAAVSDPQVLRGFVLTTYAAKGEAGYLGADYAGQAEKRVLTPGVKVLLAKYSPLMSSVPGLPFTVDIDAEAEGVSLKISADHGELNEWNRETGVVTPRGQSFAMAPGQTVYWGPGSEADAGEITITIEALTGGTVAGRQEISITQDEAGCYYAVAGEMERI